MKIAIIASQRTDISHLLTSVTWSGDVSQAARKLDFTFVQDDRDELIPVIDVDTGYTVWAADDKSKICFVGNIYQIERDRAKSQIRCICYDNLFVLNRSKTTKKYTDALPEDIAVQICKEMGVYVGNIAKTGEKVSFIANSKTGYQIIMAAYTEAHKKNEKIYQCIMNGDALDVIEKGSLIEGLILDSAKNMTDSIYHESIENFINQVLVVDDKGNTVEYIKNDEQIKRYSMFQTVYKTQKDKDTKKEVEAILKDHKIAREGNITALGDYKAISGYSLQVKDSLFNGQFWIKSDTHTFRNGFHEMKLNLEFENIMQEEKAEHEKPKKEKKTKTSKSGRKRKRKNKQE